MAVVTMKQLLESGVHFGHQAKRWNPKMAKYIFTERNGIHVIDLHKSLKKIEEAYEVVREISANGGNFLFVGTKKQAQEAMKEQAERVIDLHKSLKKIEEAYEVVREISANGGNFLFVGTKKQAQEAMKEQAERSGMFYVNNRWLGGMLTNFQTIKGRIARLKELTRMDQDGTLDTAYTKKEAANLRKELEKLNKNLAGIQDMPGVPAALFVVDVKKEALAVAEAANLGIPVIAMIDTNVDPDNITYPIPANDDAIRSVKLMSTLVANAIIEGRQGSEEKVEEVATETTEAEEVVENGSAE